MVAHRSITSRSTDGNLKELSFRTRFLAANQFPLTLAYGTQVHETRIEWISHPLTSEQVFDQTDGFLTQLPNQPLGIFTADCFPIFLSSARTSIVGVLHAGWRGVHKKILSQAVRMIRSNIGALPKDLDVWPGPGIAPCCFKVQWDVARYFPKARIKKRTGWHVDLPKAIELEARQLGCKWRRTAPICTVHQKDYFSYRRDQSASRLLSVIMRNP